MPPTHLRQNANGSSRLYTFGIISPKSKRRNVSSTVMQRNSSHSALPKLMVLLNMKLQSMMMVTLTKLLAIRMVAKVRSLSSRSLAIFLSRLLFSGFNSFKSDGERLKKAISLPLANPDIKSRIRVSAMQHITPMVGEVNDISEKSETNAVKSIF